MQNPFKINEKPKSLSSSDYEDLIEITSVKENKDKFNELSLESFWGFLMLKFPNICEKAIKTIIPFGTTYFCESGFSRYASVKSKYRNRLDASADIRIQLSRIKPNFKKMVKRQNQLHPSH